MADEQDDQHEDVAGPEDEVEDDLDEDDEDD